MVIHMAFTLNCQLATDSTQLSGVKVVARDKFPELVARLAATFTCSYGQQIMAPEVSGYETKPGATMMAITSTMHAYHRIML